MKGGVFLASQGYVLARVYTSDAYIPLAGVPVTFTLVRPNGSRQQLAVLHTDQNGLTQALAVETPDKDQSLTPGVSSRPYATVEISTAWPGYSPSRIRGVQIFPDVETIQGLQLRPQPAASPDLGDTRDSGAQNL